MKIIRQSKKFFNRTKKYFNRSENENYSIKQRTENIQNIKNNLVKLDKIQKGLPYKKETNQVELHPMVGLSFAVTLFILLCILAPIAFGK